jgi:DNA-binding NarL/FixJ family response regulator
MTPATETNIRPNEQSEAALQHRVTPRWEPLRVLLVEDSAIIREHLTEAIATSENVKVIGYADTESDAVAALQENECDVIILDLGLAEGSGLQVLKAVRSDIAYSPVVVVFTNYTNPNSRKQTIKMGADYFLSKSEDFDRLRRIMQGLASSHEVGDD